MFNRAVCLVSLVTVFVTASTAQTLPPADQVLVKLRVVNDQFLRAWPNPGADIVTDRARPDNIWTRATYFEGLMALHKIAPDARYTDYAVRWANSHDWNLAYGSTTDRVADDQCCGQTYLDLYALDPRPERIVKIKTAIDNMVNSTKSDDWWWIDALQMAMPIFARFGVLTGDARYFDKMHALYTHTRSVEGGHGLYNPVEHLWWRDADFDPPYTEPNGANCYWSRGNGWVFAALARVLDVLPADSPHRAEYLQTFQDMAAALVPLQRSDGFWNVSLMDPDNYGGRELSGTAFFTYGMAWGINQGHLPRATYLPVVAQAWHALADLAVRPDGTLGYAQGSGKQPSDSQPVTYASEPNFDDFGTGAFLLAGSEVYRLANASVIDYIGFWRESSVRLSRTNGPAFFTGTPLGLVVRVRGTRLAHAFASPPTLVYPDGTSHPLAYQSEADEWSFYEGGTISASSQNKVERASAAHQGFTVAADAAPQSGSYTLVIGENSIRDLASGEPPPDMVYSGEWPSSADQARSLRFMTGPFVSRATGESFLTVTLTPASRPEHLIEGTTLLGTTANAPLLTLPPYALDLGPCAFAFDFRHRTLFRNDVNLGSLGSHVLVEAGARSRAVGLSLAVTEPTRSRGRLVNVSSRGLASAANPLIAGFVVSPGGPKMVLIRAVGPALQNFGVTGALSNPYLRVFNSNRTRAWQSDDWQSTPQYLALDSTGATTLLASYTNVRDPAAAATESGAFPLTPRSRDAALVVVLPPGNYTAQVTPSGTSAAGAALVEVYELTTTQTNPRLTNLSTRGTVSATETLTAGFVITGGSKRVLVRAVGPTLAAVGLPAATTLRDPKLAVFNAAGTQLAENDNWSDAPNSTAQVAFRASLGAFSLPAGSKDAETVLTLDPGAYTIRVSSGDGGSGTALAEVYSEPPGS